MIGAVGETVLPRRVQQQPTPELNPGGDCGACVLGGALGLSVEAVYDNLKGGRQALHREEMARVLRIAVSRHRADRMIEEPVNWHTSLWASFGQPAFLHALAWFNYVRMAIDAGYYGLAMVDFRKHGGPSTDHWVLICGARYQGVLEGGGLIRGEVLVSCSARSSGMREEWVDAHDFLKHRGGYDILFVRPKEP